MRFPLWGDLLKGFNNLVYTYDEIGNPVSDTLRNYTWEHGRQLATLTVGNTVWNYTYDHNGLRTKRSNGTTTYEYVYSGDKLVQVITTDHTTTPETVSIVEYAYDAAGQPLTMTLGEDVYYYVLNVQGDVMGLVDSSGTLMITYYYEGYGECYSQSNASLISANNYLLYRGYVADKDTALYYLQSRYFDPNVGRFINADNQLSTGSDLTGLNLFAYCGNNPVNRIDPTGEAWWHWAIGAAIVVACAAATVVTCGGFAAAAGAVAAVSCGIAAATTASTVAAAAFVGAATVYGTAVIVAASNSNSVEEFCDQGNWGTVAATAVGGLVGGYDGYTMSKAQTPTATTGKGTQNPKVKAAIQKGQAMHKQMDYGPGVLKEQTIAPGCRVDGIDFNNHIIYELKPNNPQAIARGISQLNRYTAAASQQYGGTWTGVLKLYD